MNLRVGHEHLELMKREAYRVYPVEACGLLFGKSSKESALVKSIIITKNALKSSVSFEIDPKVFHDSFMESKQHGLDFLGFFHSHPTSAAPSSVDARFMRLWGDAIWLILSMNNDEFAAFQIRKGKIQALRVKVEGKP